MGAADCGESHQPGAKDEATAARVKVAVRLTQSPVEPANDSEQEFIQGRGADKAGAAAAEECSEVEVEMVRRLVASGRYDDARDLIHHLRDSREGSDALELLLSEIYIVESRLSDATASIMALLGKNPDNPATLQSLVRLYRMSGDTVKALEVRCLRCSASPSCSLSQDKELCVRDAFECRP